MKHIGKELYHIIERKRLVKKRIAEQLNMDPSRFNALMHRESLDAKLLDRICKIIEVSPGFFFDDWPSDKYTIGDITSHTVIGDASVNIGENTKHLEEAIKSKDQLIAEKDQRIEEKERLIKLLAERAGIDL